MRSSKIVLLFAALALVLSSCGGDDGGPKPVAAKSQAPPTSVVSEEPAGTGSSSGSNHANKGSKKSVRLTVQEGVTTQSDTDYTTSKFSPRTTFHTPDLAYPFFAQQDRSRVLGLDSEVGGLLLFRPTGIFDPDTGRPAPPPDDLTDWVTANEHIKAGPVEPVSLAGLEGSQVDGVVTSTIAKKDDCDKSCIQLAPLPGGESVWFIEGDYMRVMSFHVKGQLLGVGLFSDKSGFRQLLSAATKLLKTIEFH
jgi:hypothetical protein